MGTVQVSFIIIIIIILLLLLLLSLLLLLLFRNNLLLLFDSTHAFCWASVCFRVCSLNVVTFRHRLMPQCLRRQTHFSWQTPEIVKNVEKDLRFDTSVFFLSFSVRHATTLSSFKSKLKTHLFSSAYWFLAFLLLFPSNPRLLCLCFCGVCVCGWGVCVCVCVCGSGMLICFVSALGSHEMGHHKLPIIIIIINTRGNLLRIIRDGEK